jgi:hypothetical protein
MNNKLPSIQPIGVAVAGANAAPLFHPNGVSFIFVVVAGSHREHSPVGLEFCGVVPRWDGVERLEVGQKGLKYLKTKN